MSFVNFQYGWFRPEKDWDVESSQSGDRARITINFPKMEDENTEGYISLSLDEAEKLARKVLDVVVDARMGRFTDVYGDDGD
jgi:hypothetical protein